MKIGRKSVTLITYKQWRALQEYCSHIKNKYGTCLSLVEDVPTSFLENFSLFIGKNIPFLFLFLLNTVKWFYTKHQLSVYVTEDLLFQETYVPSSFHIYNIDISKLKNHIENFQFTWTLSKSMHENLLKEIWLQ